ncbi:MAG: hypothetical protein IKF71_04980 [Bacilli bacterium]|nr:hypothetical protein [Bacilli bacterium]
MKKRLDDYIKELEEAIEKKQVSKKLEEEVFTKIQFTQHERLIHLIVTMFMGLFCVLFLLAFITLEQILLLLLFVITLCLFIPYIFHYYYLENGTQKLYDIYFEIKNTEK